MIRISGRQSSTVDIKTSALLGSHWVLDRRYLRFRSRFANPEFSSGFSRQAKAFWLRPGGQMGQTTVTSVIRKALAR